jgi:ribosome biogenesis GTPase
MLLESLGVDAFVRRHFEPFAAQGLTLARVAVSHRHAYQVWTAAGAVAAEPSGRLAGCPEDLPVTGDWVAVRMVDPSFAILEAVLPRRTLFARRAAGREWRRQPVAANIDTAFLVCGLDGDFNLRRLERYLTLAAESGADPVVVCNKADLHADPTPYLTAAAGVAPGVAVVAASGVAPGGLEELRPFLTPGRTVALLGSSGTGKSTLVNALAGTALRTAAVRAADSRGRHTTTHRELIALESGALLVDTPGMRELQLWAGPEALEAAFPEIASLGERCRFRDCTHGGEPGCAVVAGVEEARLASYRKLLREAQAHEERGDGTARKRARTMHKAMKRYYAETGSS